MLQTLKKICPALLLLNCNHCFSGTIGPVNSVNNNGFYLGANIGVSNLQDKTKHYVSPEIHHLGGIGVIGGGLVGYDFSITNTLQLDIEAFGNAAGLNSSIQHYDQTTGIQDNSEQISSRYNVGVRLLPGYKFTPNIEGHFIVGYSNASFKQLDNGTYGYIDTHFNKNGIQGGAGWKANILNQHTFLRLDVIYTRYAGQLSRGTGLANSGSPYQYYSDTFSTLESDLSLIYKFD